jgi:hypothetical protein
MAKCDRPVMSRLSKRSPLRLLFCPGFPSLLKTLAASLAPTGIGHYMQSVIRI